MRQRRDESWFWDNQPGLQLWSTRIAAAASGVPSRLLGTARADAMRREKDALMRRSGCARNLSGGSLAIGLALPLIVVFICTIDASRCNWTFRAPAGRKRPFTTAPLHHRIRHRRTSLQHQMTHHGDRQMLHHLRGTRYQSQRSPTLPRTSDRCRRMTGPCRRQALLRSVRPNAQWLSRSGRSTEAGS